MRIIAGTAGGRKLKSIKGTPTRPTLDRVKESLFSIINFYIPAASVLDLFAGFGSLGLESLSRGAKELLLVEKNKRNIQVIKENVEICNFSDKSTVIRDDVFIFLQNISSVFDLILMDPPYGKNYAVRALELIIKNKVIAQDGIVVVEHGVEEKMKDYQFLTIIKSKSYGDTGITIYSAKG